MKALTKLRTESVEALDRRNSSGGTVLVSYSVNDIEHYDLHNPNAGLMSSRIWGTCVKVEEGMLYLVKNHYEDGNIVTTYNNLYSK